MVVIPTTNTIKGALVGFCIKDPNKSKRIKIEKDHTILVATITIICIPELT